MTLDQPLLTMNDNSDNNACLSSTQFPPGLCKLKALVRMPSVTYPCFEDEDEVESWREPYGSHCPVPSLYRLEKLPPPPEGKRCAKGTQPIGNTAESQHSTIMPIYSFIQALLSTSY